MKVLILTSSFPRHEGDVAGTFVAEHARVLAEAGHDVHVMTWDDRSPSRWAPENVRVSRVRYAPRRLQRLYFGAGAPENLGGAPWLAGLIGPSAASMLARATLAARDAELIIGHWLVPGGALARIVGRALGKPTFVVGHSGGVHLLGSLPRSVGRIAARRLGEGAISFPTRALKERFDTIAERPSDATVLPMGCPTSAVLSQGEDWLVLARLVPIKNLELAIRAFSASRSAATLHIAGDGPERRRLEALARSLRARVVFHGWVRGDDKRALLEKAGYLLMTSKVERRGRHEGLPVAVLEAQAAGLLPLVAATPGMHEAVFAEECVVEGWEVATWAERIDRHESRSDEARDRARAFGRAHTWEALGPRWLELLVAAAMSGGEGDVMLG